ncbi:Peptidoglycan-binding Lysin subgroup [Penicillium sp. IBT 18751x]|nr:Peptidoglycan-binding Lysin subgroup [Penicillium sp. IBT 18751x]
MKKYVSPDRQKGWGRPQTFTCRRTVSRNKIRDFFNNVRLNDDLVVFSGRQLSLSRLGPAGAIKASNDANARVKNLASYITNAALCGSTAVLSKVGETVATLYTGTDVYLSSVGPYLDSFTKSLEGGSQTI